MAELLAHLCQELSRFLGVPPFGLLWVWGDSGAHVSPFGGLVTGPLSQTPHLRHRFHSQILSRDWLKMEGGICIWVMESSGLHTDSDYGSEAQPRKQLVTSRLSARICGRIELRQPAGPCVSKLPLLTIAIWFSSDHQLKLPFHPLGGNRDAVFLRRCVGCCNFGGSNKFFIIV